MVQWQAIFVKNYYCLTLACLLAVIAVSLVPSSKTGAVSGINQQMNYQARLLGSTGATVPDGTYNMRFKIYCDGDGVLGGSDPGSCSDHATAEHILWTETRTGSDKVTVTNGYFTVQLGSVTAFGSSVDWNQSKLWLSIDVGGTGTPTWDGEMSPFRRLSASPYALNAGQLGGRSAAEFLQLAPAAAQTDSSTASSVFVNKTGASGNILQLQKATSNVLTIGNTGTTLFQPTADGTTIFNVKSALANNVFTVDTQNSRVGINLGGNNTPSTYAEGLEVRGALKLSGDALQIDKFVTPLGASINTKINVPLYDVGNFSQILALGLNATSSSSARGITLVDARTGTHQPTLSVLSPDENQIVGLSWDGSNTSALLKATVNTLNLQPNGVNALSAVNSSGAARVGINNTGPSYTLDVTGDVNSSTQYRIGGTTICTSSGCTPATGSGNYIQNSTSTQSSSNFNISGTGVAGAALQAPSFDTATAAALSIGGTNATTITVGSASSTSTLTLGQSTASQTINIGNATIAAGNTGTINIGTNATSTGKTVITIGSTNAASTTTIQGGTGNINLLTNSASASIIAKSNTNSTSAFQIQNASAAPVFNVDTTNKRIGLGTATPNYAIQIDQGTATAAHIQFTAGTTTGTTNSDGFTVGIDTTGAAYLINFENQPLFVATNSTVRMKLNAAGDLSVGRDFDATNALHIDKGTATGSFLQFTAGTTTGTTATDGLVYGIDTAGGGYFWNYENQALGFATNNTLRMTIKNDGKLSFGNNIAGQLTPMQADFGAGNASTLNFTQGGSTGTYVGIDGTNNGYLVNTANSSLQLGSNNIIRVMIAAGGLVGIGPNAAGFTATNTLDVDGTVRVRTFGAATATTVCRATTGNIGTLSTCSSSQRYKEDIRDMSYGLDTIKALRAVNFKWKERNERDIGFIAEEVARVVPEVVVYNADGQVEGIDYHLLTAVLTKAMQEQQVQIDQLQNGSSKALQNGDEAQLGSLNVSGSTKLNKLHVLGDATIDGDLAVSGLMQVTDIAVNGHIVTRGGAPTATPLAKAGNGAEVNINGNDTAGVITIVTGESPTPEELTKIIFNKAFEARPAILLTPVGRKSADLNAYVDRPTASEFIVGASTKPEQHQTYSFNYHVLQ